jgi:hypothetical protein
MQGDFSRTTFDPLKHYSAVLAQQGRVQLDADLNEQAAILLYQLRTMVADVLGPAGAPTPSNGGGFTIDFVDTKRPPEDLAISKGRMYVEGILVENDANTTYRTQPDLHLDADDTSVPQDTPNVFVYLRVWERLITALQDPTLREVALGDPGPDTAARAKTIWQVAAFAVTSQRPEEYNKRLDDCQTSGLLTARAILPAAAADNPCHLPPDSRFRGPENQLYRIEVHTGGLAWPENTGPSTGNGLSGATFKWSRENASVVFPIVSLTGAVAKVTALGRDGKLGLEVGDRVEIVDDWIAGRVADDIVLTGPPTRQAPRLRQVVAIDPVDLLVTLDQQHGDEDCGLGPNALLRRWDHQPTASTPSVQGSTLPVVAADGALPLVEGPWLDLEDGVQVRFQPRPSRPTLGSYRRGDYWLIPARTATGDVLWPQDKDGARPLPPSGVQYHYAPLAYVSDKIVSLLKTFDPLSKDGVL